MTAVPTSSVLIELGCEELPAGHQAMLAQQWADGLHKGLTDAGLLSEASISNTWVTPRRLAWHCTEVKAVQPEQSMVRKGPAVTAAFDDQGQATAAATGFARSVGLELDQLEQVETDQGRWLQATIHQPGQALAEVVQGVLDDLITQMAGARSMRWSEATARFVRPVRWVLALHGEAVLPIQLFGLTADRLSYGHRIHAPGPHALDHSDHYLTTLTAAGVQPDPVQRRAIIVARSETLANQAQLRLQIDERVLDEVVGLTEWPVPVLGAFDPRFLEVPAEALVSSLQQHQKSFPLRDATGRLAAHFIAVANVDSQDPEAMRAGFERVIKPRLADAQFFYQQDRRQSLSAWRERLDQIAFQQGLGTVGDKVRRIMVLAPEFAEWLGASPQAAGRAAELCKCDLLSDMVGEFPELQGIMGRYYALADGEPEVVAESIEGHYLPRHAGDALPNSAEAQALALADRLDTLVGSFAAGHKPRSGKDPFALRRTALAVVRILQDSGSVRPLVDWIEAAGRGLPADLNVTAEVLEEVQQFVLDRLRSHALDLGLDAQTWQAVSVQTMAQTKGSVADLMARAKAVQAFADDPLAEPLIAANKRIANLLKQHDGPLPDAVRPEQFEDPTEQALFQALVDSEAALEQALTHHHHPDYSQALTTLAGLRQPVDAFFEGVMVMAEDLAVRANRLALLARLRAVFLRVADVARLGR